MSQIVWKHRQSCASQAANGEDPVLATHGGRGDPPSSLVLSYLHDGNNRRTKLRQKPTGKIETWDKHLQSPQELAASQSDLGMAGAGFETDSLSCRRSLLQSRIRHSSPGYRQPPPQQPQQQRWIGGALYRVSANKLFKTSSTSDFNAKLSPRAGKCTAVTDWPGQSLPGSLGRALTTRHIASRAVQRSLAIIRQAKLKKQQKREYCMYYNRFGKCNRGEKCPFIHDPDKVAVCTRFLRGTCKQTDGSCPFSHKVSKEKMPVCSYFLKGICNNSTCPYSHVYVSRKAEVCQDFLKGYCPLGEKCKKQHTLLCPDFAKTGSCLLGSKCKLQHRQRKRPAKAPETRGVPKRVKTEQEQEQDSCVAVVAPGSEAGKDRTVEPEPEVAGPCPRLEKLPSYISLCSSPTEGEGKAGEPTGESADNTEKRLQIKPRF
ncbi:Zinc finger CCCH domain-containing protein 3 [Acipenser ruthenus]|uniref:Zinc finger CCCH domain-containing protein 3 n=1 Tax=Acipenser ruthenus TaxID=7906 RepID=A0A444U2N8_ACIRT|nr:Zinc finger CCCH domain-containing protein 3 [Acipenser ruthenus]